jgi:hypothetical protein
MGCGGREILTGIGSIFGMSAKQGSTNAGIEAGNRMSTQTNNSPGKGYSDVFTAKFHIKIPP